MAEASIAAKMEKMTLSETESKDLIRQSGIKVVDTRLATSKKSAISLSREMGFPVAMKIASRDITHKSDVGGVKLGLTTMRQVANAYTEMLSSVRSRFPQAKIDGVSVQKMARPGTELVVGVSRDPQFGPVMMFGLGGVTVEVIQDVAFRLIPLTKFDAEEMVHEIKGYPLLTGYRGREAVSIPSLVETLLLLSRFIERHPEVVELDLNPILGYEDGLLVVDARVIVDGTKPL